MRSAEIRRSPLQHTYASNRKRRTADLHGRIWIHWRATPHGMEPESSIRPVMCENLRISMRSHRSRPRENTAAGHVWPQDASHHRERLLNFAFVPVVRMVSPVNVRSTLKSSTTQTHSPLVTWNTWEFLSAIPMRPAVVSVILSEDGGPTSYNRYTKQSTSSWYPPLFSRSSVVLQQPCFLSEQSPN